MHLETCVTSIVFAVWGRRQSLGLTDVVVEDCVMVPIPLHSARNAVNGCQTCLTSYTAVPVYVVFSIAQHHQQT